MAGLSDMPMITAIANDFSGNAWFYPITEFMLALGPMGSPFAAGRLEAVRAPWDGVMMTVPRWDVDEASSSGALEFDIEKNGTTIFTTTPTIDATENDSDDAATPAVFDGTITFSRGDLFEFHCLDEGAGDAEGPKVTLYWRRTGQ